MSLRHRLALVPLLTLSSAALILPTGCNRDPNVRKQKYLESGMRYEKDGKYREATIQFSNALKVDRNFANAHYELGNTYIKMGSMSAGYAELLHAVDLDPKNVKSRIDLGNLQLAGGLPEKALEQAKTVLAQDPNNALAYALLANYWGRKGDHDQALQNIQKALAIDPNQSSFHVILAMLQAPATPDAPVSAGTMQELQKAIAIDNKNNSARMLLASLLMRQKDFNGAAAQLKDAIRIAPKELGPREALTRLYLEQGNKPEAEQTLRQTAEDLADDPAGAQLLSSYYVTQGQLGQADSAYADLSGKHPKSVELKLAYARILMLEHQPEKAQKLATELTKSAPNNPQVAILNSSLLLTGGKVNEAFDVMKKAVGSAPENGELQVAFGKVSLQKQDFATAGKAFTDALRIAPRSLDAATGLADVASHNKDYTQLIQIAEKVLAFAPNFPQAYVWRGDAEGSQGQLDKAQADFGTALSKNPKNTAALLGMAEVKLAQKKAPEANALLEQVLEVDPGSAVALRQLVRSDLAASQPDKALARVKDQIGRLPNSESLYSLLANLQMTTRDFAGAQASSAKAISLNAADEEPVQIQAQSQAALGNKDAAISVWQTWIQAHPTDAAANTMVGLLEEQKGDPTKAVDFYKKAIQLNPGATTAMASNNLAYLMVEQGQDLDQALQYAQQARQAMPKSPGTADTLAWVYYHKGRYATAKDLLEGAVKDAPNDAAMQLHLGLTYSKLNDKPNAITHLKKAVALATGTPTAQQANEALAKLS